VRPFKKIIFILVLIQFTSCKKNGEGGEAYITAYVTHNGNPVNLPIVYVKFGAKSQPSDPTNDYDIKQQGIHENHVHIKHLRYGNYYVYATGYDSIAQKNVSGGNAVKIKWKQRKLETETNIAAGE
jgi:hypothetical protein